MILDKIQKIFETTRFAKNSVSIAIARNTTAAKNVEKIITLTFPLNYFFFNFFSWFYEKNKLIHFFLKKKTLLTATWTIAVSLSLAEIFPALIILSLSLETLRKRLAK